MPLRILNAEEVNAALSMDVAIDAMRSAFAQLASRQTQMPLRSATPNAKQDATMLCMPAYLENSDELGVKIVSVFPHNPRVGLATINGMMVVINAKTGQPEAILEGATLTAIRTGAVSGLATDLLARKNAKTVAILGSGAQAYRQLEAVCCVRDIRDVAVYSRTFANAQRFVSQINMPGLHIHCCETIAEATHGADIICTATSAIHPILDLIHVQPGTHINAVGSHTPEMCELTSQLLAEAKIYVDSKEAAFAEAGEVIQALQAKRIKEDDLTELGKLILNSSLGRESPEQITLFKSVGLAIQDVSAARAAITDTSQGTFVAF